MLDSNGIEDNRSRLSEGDAFSVTGGGPMSCAGAGVGEPFTTRAQSTVVSETVSLLTPDPDTSKGERTVCSSVYSDSIAAS